MAGSISLGPWGGPGGDPFNFIVPEGSWINEITVHHGSVIDSLSFRDSNDTTYGPFGGDGGGETRVHISGNSERLTSITGTYGDYGSLVVIRSLSFVTNLNTYGPFGDAVGTFFSVPIEGSVVNGFHGRAGDYVDAIGFFVIPESS